MRCRYSTWTLRESLIIEQLLRLLLQAIQPAFTFSMLITIEPMLSVEGRHHLLALRKKLVDRARKRTKCWPTLEDAIQDYNDPRRRGAKWDARVLNLFVVRHPPFRAEGSSSSSSQ